MSRYDKYFDKANNDLTNCCIQKHENVVHRNGIIPKSPTERLGRRNVPLQLTDKRPFLHIDLFYCFYVHFFHSNETSYHRWTWKNRNTKKNLYTKPLFIIWTFSSIIQAMFILFSVIQLTTIRMHNLLLNFYHIASTSSCNDCLCVCSGRLWLHNSWKVSTERC